MNLQALIQPYNSNYTSEAIGVKLAEWLKSPQFQYIWLVSAFVSQSAMAGFEPVLRMAQQWANLRCIVGIDQNSTGMGALQNKSCLICKLKPISGAILRRPYF